MSRYGIVSSAFWQADPATAGLGSLAACLLLRARSESLVGVLLRSPKVLALAHHDATPASVEAAIAELERRGLARWWPDLEILALVGGAAGVKGDAVKAVEGVLADLPADVACVLRGVDPVSAPLSPALEPHGGHPVHVPVVTRSDSGSTTGPDPIEQEQEQDQEHEQDQDPVGSSKRRPSQPARAARARPTGAKSIRADLRAIVEPALERLTVLRRELVGPRCTVQTVERDGAHMLKRAAEGVTTAQLLLVVEAEAAKVRHDPAQGEYFDAVTPFRDGNWSSRLAKAEAWDARRTRQGAPRAEPAHLTTPKALRDAEADLLPPATLAELEVILPAWAMPGAQADDVAEIDGP